MGAKNRRQKDKCRSKVTYKDMTTATASCINLSRKSENPGKIWAYRCPICKGIHIGHPSAKQRRAVKQRRAAKRE